MSAFEDRLRSQLHDTAAAVDATAPPVEPVLAAAASRRDRRFGVALSGAAVVALVVVTAALAARAVGVGGDDGGADARHRAQLTTEFASTSTTASSSPTTTVRRTATSPTTVRPASGPRPAVTTPTTVAPPTTTTTASSDPRPLSQRVPQGLWLVGLDGSRLRRIADVGRYSWSPDGTQVAVATDRIWILSAEDGHALSTVESGPPSTIVGCLDWSSKGTIGWVAQDGTVRFARATDRAATVVATGYPSTDDYLDDGCRWSPDGSLFATGGEGFVLFSPDGHRVVAAADPRAALTSHVKWSPDGRSLAAMTADHDARKTGVGVLSGQDWSHVDVVTPSSEVHRLTWTADGRKLLARTGDGLDAVDAAAGTVTVETTSCCLSVLTPLPGGDYLTVGGESMLRFVSGSWEPRGTLLTTDASATRCEGAFFASMRVSPNGRELVVEAQPRGGARCDKKHPS